MIKRSDWGKMLSTLFGATFIKQCKVECDVPKEKMTHSSWGKGISENGATTLLEGWRELQKLLGKLISQASFPTSRTTLVL